MSHTTRGRDTSIQNSVNWDGVCDHVVDTDGARARLGTIACSSNSGDSSLTVLDAERVDLLVSDFEGEAFVGDRSGGGNCRG